MSTASRRPIVRRLVESESAWTGWPPGEVAARGTLTWQTLLGEDPADQGGLVVGVARVRPGETLAPHRHEPPEVYVVLAGSGTLTIDGEPHALHPGLLVWIPGDARHGVTGPPEGTEPLRFLYAFARDGFDEVVYRFPG